MKNVSDVFQQAESVDPTGTTKPTTDRSAPANAERQRNIRRSARKGGKA